jgi:flavodoxin
MNTVVVYDSQYGNTERIAQTIAETLRKYGPARAVHVDSAHQIFLEKVDLLILGSPTQGFRPTQAMQTFLGDLSDQSLSGITVADFDTRFHGFLWSNCAARHMAKQLRALGIEPIVSPESFYVQSMKTEGPLLAGEEERAATWALGIHHQYEAKVAPSAALMLGANI